MIMAVGLWHTVDGDYMHRTKTALLVVLLALGSSWGMASAQPADPPKAALLTLTTTPSGWSTRVDLRPLLEVYADGRAVKQPNAAAADRPAETPPQRLTGTIPTNVLNAALDEIKQLGPVDFGTPGTTDQGSQIIDFMPQSPDAEVHLLVYGPEATDGLNTEQQGARKRFADLYRKLLDAFVPDH
jgi:hypothetical protein